MDRTGHTLQKAWESSRSGNKNTQIPLLVLLVFSQDHPVSGCGGAKYKLVDCKVSQANSSPQVPEKEQQLHSHRGRQKLEDNIDYLALLGSEALACLFRRYGPSPSLTETAIVSVSRHELRMLRVQCARAVQSRLLSGELYSSTRLRSLRYIQRDAGKS